MVSFFLFFLLITLAITNQVIPNMNHNNRQRNRFQYVWIFEQEIRSIPNKHSCKWTQLLPERRMILVHQDDPLLSSKLTQFLLHYTIEPISHRGERRVRCLIVVFVLFPVLFTSKLLKFSKLHKSISFFTTPPCSSSKLKGYPINSANFFTYNSQSFITSSYFKNITFSGRSWLAFQ